MARHHPDTGEGLVRVTTRVGIRPDSTRVPGKALERGPRLRDHRGAELVQARSWGGAKASPSAVSAQKLCFSTPFAFPLSPLTRDLSPATTRHRHRRHPRAFWSTQTKTPRAHQQGEVFRPPPRPSGALHKRFLLMAGGAIFTISDVSVAFIELGLAGAALVCKFLAAEATAAQVAVAPAAGMAHEGSSSPA